MSQFHHQETGKRVPSFIQIHCFLYTEIDPCVQHETLNTSDRRLSAYLTPNQTYKCDYNLLSNPKAWYRFGVNAGLRMATRCVTQGNCSTGAPGWLNGTHPTEAQGIVSRNVCFSRNDHCCFRNQTILVKNCGSFYLYELVKPDLSLCPTGYCGD